MATCREQQIVLMVSDGLSNKDIGRLLDLSEGTVKVHLHKVYGKLKVNNRTSLTAMAITCREDLQHSAYAPREGVHHRVRVLEIYLLLAEQQGLDYEPPRDQLKRAITSAPHVRSQSAWRPSLILWRPRSHQACQAK